MYWQKIKGNINGANKNIENIMHRLRYIGNKSGMIECLNQLDKIIVEKIYRGENKQVEITLFMVRCLLIAFVFVAAIAMASSLLVLAWRW